MKCLLGKKLNMGQVWGKSGEVVPVTFIQAGPCQVVQVKTPERDGHQAIQIGFGKAKKLNQALAGHLKDLPSFEVLKEFPTDGKQPWTRGDVLDVKIFTLGEKVTVVGTSKGKGFQGVVKRHHFHGHPKTHGHKDAERMPGSIGAGGVQRVFKGIRMGGHMGSEQVTVKNLEVVQIDSDKNILALRGAVPGARNSLITIQA
ncbi:MAG: 50S ribosomal protein L3 [bacterium]